MLRRIAGHCFWLGRYLERAENVARLALAAEAHRESGDDPDPWSIALTAGAASAGYHAASGEVEPTAAAAFLLADRANPSSVAQCLRAAGSNARAARDLLGDAYWEAVNMAWMEADALDAVDVAGKGPAALGEWALTRCRAIRGAAEELPREQPLQAITVGAAVERCDFLLRLLMLLAAAGAVPEGPAPAIASLGRRQLAFIVDAAGAQDEFRRLHRGLGDAAAMGAFLLSSRTSPRTLPFALERLAGSLAALVGTTPALSAVEALRDDLAHWPSGGPTTWSAVLHEAHLAIIGLGETLEQDHFTAASPPPAPRQTEG